MDKWQGKKPESKYTDPFHSPRANPKHAYHQVNGETQQTVQGQIREVSARQKNMYI